MKKVGFIGAFDKIDFILYIAKMLTLVQKKVLIVDATVLQKARYVVPAISPTVSYITEYENIDVAVGFENMNAIQEYLARTEEEGLGYDYALIDIDTSRAIEGFEIEDGYKNYFVTSFDTFAIRRGLNAISNLRTPLKLTKVLFSREISKAEDQYLEYLALGYKVVWNDYEIYFPLEKGDQSAIIENQRVAKIKFGNLTSQYRDSLTYIAEELLDGMNVNQLRKAMKNVE